MNIALLWQAAEQFSTPQTIFDAVAMIGSVCAIAVAKVYLAKNFGAIDLRFNGLDIKLAKIETTLAGLPEKIPDLLGRVTTLETAHDGRHADRLQDFERMLDRQEGRDRRAQQSPLGGLPRFHDGMGSE